MKHLSSNIYLKNIFQVCGSQRHNWPSEVAQTYIAGSMSGSFGCDNGDGIGFQVITFGNQILPCIFVVILKGNTLDINTVTIIF